MNQGHISAEVDAMSDEQFLTKIKLMIDGKITQAGMLLLGNSDFDYMFQTSRALCGGCMSRTEWIKIIKF